MNRTTEFIMVTLTGHGFFMPEWRTRPFSYGDARVIAETFWRNLTDEQEKQAWVAIERRWRETSGRFYAYNEACRIVGALTSEAKSRG